uniref:Uncharacterized protein n=1 Tax=Sphaerodactylus townsendi TaxID=933632 RepID=A0ACB8F0F7_9SAUR
MLADEDTVVYSKQRCKEIELKKETKNPTSSEISIALKIMSTAVCGLKWASLLQEDIPVKPETNECNLCLI